MHQLLHILLLVAITCQALVQQCPDFYGEDTAVKLACFCVGENVYSPWTGVDGHSYSIEDGIQNAAECIDICFYDKLCLSGHYRRNETQCILVDDFGSKSYDVAYDNDTLFVKIWNCRGKVVDEQGCLKFIHGFIFERPAYRKIGQVKTYLDCADICLNETECLSGTYYHDLQTCLLNTQSGSKVPDLFMAQWESEEEDHLHTTRAGEVTYFQKHQSCIQEDGGRYLDDACFIKTNASIAYRARSTRTEVEKYSDCTDLCMNDWYCRNGVYDALEQTCHLYDDELEMEDYPIQNGTSFKKVDDCLTDHYAVQT